MALGTQELQRHRAAKVRVPCGIHLAHAAPPQQLCHPIPPHLCSRAVSMRRPPAPRLSLPSPVQQLENPLRNFRIRALRFHKGPLLAGGKFPGGVRRPATPPPTVRYSWPLIHGTLFPQPTLITRVTQSGERADTANSINQMSRF